MNKIQPPWNDEQIEALNEFQKDPRFHPFTCGNRDPKTHKIYGDHWDYGVLVATKDGWVCPDCDYTQGWALEFMGMKHGRKEVDLA